MVFSFAEHPNIRGYLFHEKDKIKFELLMRHVIGIALFHKNNLYKPFPIPIQGLKKYGFYKYQRVFEILVKRVGSYQFYLGSDKQGKCFEYQFTDEFFKCELKFIDTQPNENAINHSFNPKMVKIACDVLKSVTVQDNKIKISTPKQANFHFNKILTYSITPEYIAGRLSIDSKEKTYIVKGRKEKIETLVIEFLQQKVKASQFAGGYILNELRQGHFFCSVSPTNGRLNTSFTSLSEKLTDCIRLRGDKIKGFDLKNSQFLLYAHILQNALHESKKKPLYSFLQRYEKHQFGKEGGTIYTIKEVLDFFKGFDFSQYLTGDFYEFLENAYNGSLYDSFAASQQVTRATAKTAFFAILFGKSLTSEFAREFRKKYPSIFAITKEFKAKFGYKYLSMFLQKVESLIFIENLMPMLYNSNILCLPKHDSLYTTEKDFKKMVFLLKPFFHNLFNEKYRHE